MQNSFPLPIPHCSFHMPMLLLELDLSLNSVEQIGPNVSISANARIGAGVRLISCIILDAVEVKVNNFFQQKSIERY